MVDGCSRAPSQPSLVLVVEQGVRADHTSLYGYVRPTTPHAESLANEGAVFEAAYTSTPVPPGGVASLLTGRYPPEHGLLVNAKLWPGVKTLASVLKAAGYQTHAVISDPAVTDRSGLLEGFDKVERVDPSDSDDMEGGAAATTGLARTWLRSGLDTGRPFFLLVVYSSPTLPFRPPEKFRYQFVDPIVNRARVDAVSEYWTPFARRYTAREVELSREEMDMIRDLYDGEIAYVDDQATAVVGALREKRILDSTLVVVTSDRGEDLGEQHRLADPSSLREVNVRVPLVMRYPPRIKAGTRVKGLAQDVDLAPTVCALLGLPKADFVTRQAVTFEPMDGSVTRGGAVSVALREEAPGVTALLMSIRDPRYRYVVSPSGPLALYDLEKDPQEFVDILARSPQEAEALHAKLADWDASLVGPGGGGGAGAVATGAGAAQGTPPRPGPEEGSRAKAGDGSGPRKGPPGPGRRP